MNYAKTYRTDDEEESITLRLFNARGYLFEFEGAKYHIEVDLKVNRDYSNRLFVVQDLSKIVIDYHNSYYSTPWGDRTRYYDNKTQEDDIDICEQDITAQVIGADNFHIRLVHSFIQECLKTLDLNEVKKEFLRLEYEMVSQQLASLKQRVLETNTKAEFLNFKMKNV